jgi:AcrR family transcriptional regulator
MDERKKKIVNTVLELFMEQGASFKMEDVAKAMKISKKTIYKEFGNKEEMIVLVVQSVFEGIEHQLQSIMKNESYDTLEKLIRVTCAVPDSKDIDYHRAIKLKDDFPRPYEMFLDYIEDNWELNRMLFEAAVAEGRLKDVDYETFRIIMLGISKQVLNTDCEDKEALINKCVRQVFEGFIQR